MTLADWLLLASVLIGVFFVFVGFILWGRNHTNTGVSQIERFVSNWSVPSPGPDSTRNTCKTYNFPGSFITRDSETFFVPGNVSFDSLDDLTPISKVPACIDVDQLIARQVTRTCERGKCMTEKGDVVVQGFKETLYSNTTCSAVKLCQGQLSLLVPNYLTGDKCIRTNGKGPISLVPCDPTDQTQLLRISRVNAGENPNGPNKINNDGLVGRIYDRINDLCLRPSSTDQTISVDLSQYGGCSGTVSITGKTLEFGSCNTPVPEGLYPGYVWGFIPSISYCPDSNGCPFLSYSVPPQIIYLGDLDFSTFPYSGLYQGLTGTNAVIRWLLVNQAKSIVENVLGPMQIIERVGSLPVNPCPSYPSVIQYIDVSIYNSTKDSPVCIVGLVQQNCISL